MKLKIKKKQSHQNGILLCIQFFNIFMEYSDIDSFHAFIYKYFVNSQKIEDNEDILANIIEGYGIICKRANKKLFNEKYINMIIFIQKILQRKKNKENIITYAKGIKTFGRYIYYQCISDDNGYKLTNEFLKLLPVVEDLVESKIICSEFFDQINEYENILILNDRNKEEAKEAIKRIIILNSNEHFIDDITKLLAISMNLSLQFN